MPPYKGCAHVLMLYVLCVLFGTTAVAADQVVEFVLIDADSDLRVTAFDPLATGDAIPLDGTRYNIEALTSPGNVGGVSFELRANGTLVRQHTEANPAYALFGNTGSNFFPWSGSGPQANVTYTLRATPASGDGPLQISFVFESPVDCAGDSTCDDGLFCNGAETCQGGSCIAGTSPCDSGQTCDENAARCADPPPPDDTSPIVSFTLMDADSDAPIAGQDPLQHDAVLEYDQLPRLNVRANVSYNPGSIRFVLREDGQAIRSQIENLPPYALFGNSGDDYDPWPGIGPRAGRRYEVEAVPFSASGAGGTALPGLTVAFEVSDGPTADDCTTDGDCDDGLFCNGDEQCSGGACVAGSAPCGNDPCNEEIAACEEEPGPDPPDEAQCDSDSDCDDGVFCNGDERCLAGLCVLGAAPCATITLCDEGTDTCASNDVGVTRLRLINADADQVLGQFDPLNDGDLLDLDVLPRLNIEALTSPAVVGRVDFELRRFDELIRTHTEFGFPYALFGNSGSDFFAWNGAQAARNYTVKAIPYDQDGIAGTPLSVMFTTTDDIGAPVADPGRTPRTVEDLDDLGSAIVVLDGSASRGIDAPLVRYEWTELNTSGGNVLLGEGLTLAVALEIGSHTLELVVEDANGARSLGRSVQVDVVPFMQRDLGDLGTFRRWHRVQIAFTGPPTGAAATPNPFDIEVDVAFSGPGGTWIIPAFYDGDGAGGLSGNIWKVRFSPPGDGPWSFVSQSDNAALAGYEGRFDVVAPAPGAPALRRFGTLRDSSRHYLKHADGPYWIKTGMDDPENLIGDAIGDWNAKKDVIDFISARGVNSVYIITNNVDGDRGDTWPWMGDTESAVRAGDNSRRFNVAKLADWEDFFTYCEDRDVVLHLVLNDDEAWTGYDHDRYYRELVARFGHHPGIVWNIGEEADKYYSDNQQRQFALKLDSHDPYDHPITVHRQVLSNDARWPFVDEPGTHFDLASIQVGQGGSNFSSASMPDVNYVVRRHREISADAGKPLAIMIDEFPGIDTVNSTTIFNLRRKVGWAALLGGGGVELHYRDAWSGSGQVTPYALAPMWEDLQRARTFVELLPFEDMAPDNGLLAGENGFSYCLAKPGLAYGVYLSQGESVQLDLRGEPGPFAVSWYDVRSGDSTSGATLQGGEWVNLGTPPYSNDVAAWIIHFDYLPAHRERAERR